VQKVTPKVYLIGHTCVSPEGLLDYLKDTGNEDFLKDYFACPGLSSMERLCSFYAKLCYNSLSVGHNANVTKTRGIVDNLISCFESKHGSVFEHVSFNFVVHNCSRVFTHEMVRHRVGVAYSQQSGRYCRLDQLRIVCDPQSDIDTSVLGPLEEAYLKEAAKLDGLPFAEKKRKTSALRRIFAPSGLANEFGFSINLRQLRHVLILRTSRHADWEMREIFGQIYNLLNDKFSMIFYGLKVEEVDGYLELTENPNVHNET